MQEKTESVHAVMSKLQATGLQKTDGLDIHLVEDHCVVYDTVGDRIHYLNPTAALVLELCDGNRSPTEIAALVREAYGLATTPLDEIIRCLSSLQEMEIVR
jgi:hypothetical protein